MSKKKILIVEDERITAEDLKMTLQKLGYDISGIASSSDTFYACISNNTPDLILMDIFIKGEKDGIQLASEIKEKYKIPVIYLTAYSDASILERAQITEPFGYILKPFQERELHSNIEMALHKHRTERHLNHLNEILKAIREINQIIVRVTDPIDLITRTCETLIETKAYSSAWLIRTKPDGEFIDIATAGKVYNLSEFTTMLQSGKLPDCIQSLIAENINIITINKNLKCIGCPAIPENHDNISIISKIYYLDTLYGYLTVSLPNVHINETDEHQMLIEISEDLGLALNNLEQLRKQKSMQEALSISEEKFKALYLNAPLSFQSLDSDGRIIDINPMWESTLGYEKKEIIGKWFGDFLHPEYVEHFKINFPAFKQRGYIKDVQFVMKKKSGDYIHTSFEGCIGYTPEGEFRQTYCVFKDITHQKKIEEALKSNEVLFRHAFDFAATSMCMASLEGKFLKVNNAFVNLLEYTEEEVTNFHFNDITHPDDKAIGLSAIHSLISNNIESISFEKRYITKSGKTKSAQVSVSLVRDEHNEPKFFISHIIDISQRKLAEAKLRESEEQLRTLINIMPDIVCFKDGKGRWLVANDFDLKLFQLENIEYKGKSDAELAEYSPHFREAFITCIDTDNLTWESREPSRSDETITLPDGSLLTFDVIKTPTFDEKGKRKGLLVVGRDVTERNKVEHELQKLSQVVEQSPDSIIVTDTNGIIEYANESAYRISGYQEGELTGKKVSILNSNENDNFDWEDMRNTIQKGSEWKGIFKNKNKKGKIYWQRSSISALKNQKGEITHFLSIQEDISEQKHNESIQQALYNISKQAIETTELTRLFENIKNELNQLLDASNFFVAFYNSDDDTLTSVYSSDENEPIETWPAEKSLTGYVVKNNKSLLLQEDDFQKMVKKGEVELIGQNSAVWMGVPLVSDGSAYGAFVIQNYTNPEAYTIKELRMLEFIASQVSISIQRQKSIEDLKEALKKSEAGDKIKTAFINNISHEIRTPLNGILGFSEMIISNDSSPEDNEIFFSIIRKSSKRLLNTVNSYMDISMIVSGNIEISRRATKVEPLLNEVYNDYLELAEHKGIDLRLETIAIDSDLTVNTDQEKLRKIIAHLVDNALKFTKKGLITIGASLTNNDIEFYVKDTGIGITPEARKIIFNAFMQADISATRGYEGSGLGLTIAHGLTTLLGGSLNVDSEVGSGSTFYVTLPISQNNLLVKDLQIKQTEEKPEEKPLILVAEDDDSNFKYIEIVLKYASFEILRAENGLEAIELCKNNSNIKLILMDIKMPIMDGFEATKNIRTFLPNLPVIALTAYVTAEDENAAFASGCNEYITKPVSKNRLLEIIHSAIYGKLTLN